MPIIVPDPPAPDIVVDVSMEIRINRKNTTAFIRANPQQIALIPVSRVRQASGGSKFVDQPPRPVQTFRLIPRDETTLPTFNDEGQQRTYDLVLLGQWSAGMNIGDWWRDTAGFKYEIMDVQSNAYEVKGAVVKHGNR